MAIPDEDLYPTATGEAANTVKEHEKPADLIFYAGWFCPFVQRVWMALEEKGIPYQYKEVNPYKKDPEFLEISPKGLVPVIVTQGKSIPESTIIMEYLEDAFPDKKPLMPKDPIDRAHVRYAIDHISKHIVPNFFKLFQAQGKEEQDQVRSALENAFIGFVHRCKGPFLLGEQLTLADIALAPFVARIYLLEQHRGFNLHKKDVELGNWMTSIEHIPSFKKTLSDRDKFDRMYQRYLDNTFQCGAAKAAREGKPIP